MFYGTYLLTKNRNPAYVAYDQITNCIAHYLYDEQGFMCVNMGQAKKIIASKALVISKTIM